MQPEDFFRWRKFLRLTQLELADFLGVHKNTIYKWESGAQEIPFPELLRCAFREIDAILTQTRTNADALQIWWQRYA